MSIEARFQIAYDTAEGFELDVDLVVPDTGVTAIFGPSGSGKTTLLRAIAGLERHPNGFLRIGEDVWQDDARFVPPHRRRLGYVFQETSLFPHLSVRRNLEYGRKRTSETERRVALDRAIGLLGIAPLLDRSPALLSGGERQRVAIARALAVSPKLLLMDEPLASLDLTRKLEILPYLESLQAELEIPMIYVSHSHDEVTRLANHLVLLDGGRVTASGRVHDLLTSLDLPLAHRRDAEAVVAATVSEHDDVYRLSYLSFPGGRFLVTGTDWPIGSKVRLRIAARDVSLTSEPQSGTSILNIFPATIDRVSPQDKARVTVRLLVGDVPLLARVTRKSADTLGLKPGKEVYAQVKSVAVLS